MQAGHIIQFYSPQALPFTIAGHKSIYLQHCPSQIYMPARQMEHTAGMWDILYLQLHFALCVWTISHGRKIVVINGIWTHSVFRTINTCGKISWKHRSFYSHHVDLVTKVCLVLL